jgi:hypothetical protein
MARHGMCSSTSFGMVWFDYYPTRNDGCPDLRYKYCNLCGPDPSRLPFCVAVSEVKVYYMNHFLQSFNQGVNDGDLQPGYKQGSETFRYSSRLQAMDIGSQISIVLRNPFTCVLDAWFYVSFTKLNGIRQHRVMQSF